VPVPELAPGQVLVRHHYLSLESLHAPAMNDQKSYAAPQPLDEVMIGGTSARSSQQVRPARRRRTRRRHGRLAE